mmetsp:Transcript_8445/g.21904  ORF Transcript_8445/g.21904 Transcript_8445/m.21904 type:complete len:480 (-) Transcript_8445:84-1523(-)
MAGNNGREKLVPTFAADGRAVRRGMLRDVTWDEEEENSMKRKKTGGDEFPMKKPKKAGKGKGGGGGKSNLGSGGKGSLGGQGTGRANEVKGMAGSFKGKGKATGIKGKGKDGCKKASDADDAEDEGGDAQRKAKKRKVRSEEEAGSSNVDVASDHEFDFVWSVVQDDDDDDEESDDDEEEESEDSEQSGEDSKSGQRKSTEVKHKKGVTKKGAAKVSSARGKKQEKGEGSKRNKDVGSSDEDDDDEENDDEVESEDEEDEEDSFPVSKKGQASGSDHPQKDIATLLGLARVSRVKCFLKKYRGKSKLLPQIPTGSALATMQKFTMPYPVRFNSKRMANIKSLEVPNTEVLEQSAAGMGMMMTRWSGVDEGIIYRLEHGLGLPIAPMAAQDKFFFHDYTERALSSSKFFRQGVVLALKEGGWTGDDTSSNKDIMRAVCALSVRDFDALHSEAADLCPRNSKAFFKKIQDTFEYKKFLKKR